VFGQIIDKLAQSQRKSPNNGLLQSAAYKAFHSTEAAMTTRVAENNYEIRTPVEDVCNYVYYQTINHQSSSIARRKEVQSLRKKSTSRGRM